jgi:hypothetical protein
MNLFGNQTVEGILKSFTKIKGELEILVADRVNDSQRASDAMRILENRIVDNEAEIEKANKIAAKLADLLS